MRLYCVLLEGTKSCQKLNALVFKGKNGAPVAIRTRDLRLRRAALYPAELRVHIYERTLADHLEWVKRCALILV